MNAFTKNLKGIFGFVFKTHVVVNSIPSDLALNNGPLSKALLEKAGPELQKELNEAGQGFSVEAGTILQTSGCNLNCHHVFHVVVPQWKVNDTASSLKVGPSYTFSRPWVALWTPLQHTTATPCLLLFWDSIMSLAGSIAWPFLFSCR